MAPQRRKFERRRRVLYYAHQAATAPTGGNNRQETQRLREARRPSTAYGSRVRRRLRGRWFSLVPVRQQTLLIVSGGLSTLTLLLCCLHFASIRFPLLANQPAIARPLRLDRPDSFGMWLSVALLTTCTGVSLLIYQLRRHRNDDFAGRYRLWLTVLVVSGLASLNSLVSLIDWAGAILDAGFGRRVALSGADWVRLVVTFGGVILTMQLIAEMRRSRAAVGSLLVAVSLLAIPQLANWNLLQIDTVVNWTLVTTAPLTGTTALFLSLLIYLRMLYREVRKIEPGPSLRQRLQDWKVSLLEKDEEPELEDLSDWRTSPLRQLKVHKASKNRSKPQSDEPEEDNGDEDIEVATSSQSETTTNDNRPAVKRGWWPRRRKSKLPKTTEASEQEEATTDHSQTDETENIASEKSSRKRSWFGRRRSSDKTDAAIDGQDDSNPATDEAGQPADPQPDRDGKAKPRRRWLGRKRNKSQTAAEDSSATDESENDNRPTKKKRRFSLRLQPRRIASPPEEAESQDDPAEGRRDAPSSRSAATAQQTAQPNATADDDEYVDPDSIDWASLNKSERRRLRKKIKRQSRAA